MYSGYGIAFDGLGSWSCGNDFARNVMIFDDYNSSSSHSDNRKNNFSVLSEGPIDDINGRIGAAEKKFGINFSIAKMYYKHDNNYLFNGKEIYKFKAVKEMSTFPTQFCAGKYLISVESEKVSLKGNVYDVYDKYDILNIHKYLLVKNK